MLARIILFLSLILLLVISCNIDRPNSTNNDWMNNYMINLEEPVVKEKVVYQVESKPMRLIDTLFHEEIKKNNPNYKKLDKYLEQGANINSVNKYKIAVKKLGAKIPFVKEFIKNEYDEVSIEETPLLYKCLRLSKSNFDKEDYNVIKYLLEKGASPNFKTRTNKLVSLKDYEPNPLEVIIYNLMFFEKIDVVKKYVVLFKNNGLDMNTVNLICADGNLKAMQLLVSQGSSKKVDMNRIGGLFKIAEKNLDELKKFDLDFSNLETDRLVFFRETKLLEILLDLGLSPNHVCADRKIPLLFSVLEKGDGLIDFFKLLVEKYKADISIKYKNSDLISYAKSKGDKEIEEYIKSIL